MSEFELVRHIDHSGVSGTGVVAWGVEWPDGAVALRWPGEHPSTAAWEDIRGAEFIHGHGGDTVVRYLQPEARLLAAYVTVKPHLLSGHRLPVDYGPHPDHPDRLRLVFRTKTNWQFWVALLEGSTNTATHEEQAGEMRHRFITPDGDLWLEYFSPLAPADDPLTTFDREDRG